MNKYAYELWARTVAHHSKKRIRCLIRMAKYIYAILYCKHPSVQCLNLPLQIKKSCGVANKGSFDRLNISFWRSSIVTAVESRGGQLASLDASFAWCFESCYCTKKVLRSKASLWKMSHSMQLLYFRRRNIYETA